MYAVVTPFTINDRAALPAELDKVVHDVSATPGFVSVYGVAIGPDHGTAILVFESEETASLQALGMQVMEHTAMTLGTPEVGEVVVHA